MNADESTRDLLDVAHEALNAQVIPALPKADRYQALMVSNATRIVVRHLAAVASGCGTQPPASLFDDAFVVEGIRARQFDYGSAMRPALAAGLRNRLAQALAIDNPRRLESFTTQKTF